MEPKWLEWAKKLQSIAQIGLAYSRDVYDLGRFEQIRDLSVEILEQYTEIDQMKIKHLFANETGYATPKVDVRAVVFKNNKLMLVRERSDGLWSLPGGWGDIGLSPSEVAIKEVKEETGFDVKVIRPIAILDHKNHPHPISPFHIYKLFFQCEIVGGKPKESIETDTVDFFAENEIPPLSIGRITLSQIQLAFKHFHHPQLPVSFE